MKLNKLALACGLAMTTLSGAALAEFSANVALTTDYVWRGVSQTDNGPAIQGGFDYEHAETGLYAGVWGSNVDFDAGGENDSDANIELDTYGGWSSEFFGIGTDIGLIAYSYPSEDDLDFTEYYLGLSYGFENVSDLVPTVELSAQWSQDFTSEHNNYLEGAVDLSLPWELGLHMHVASYEVGYGADDYVDWKVALGRSFGGFDFELAYTDTDIDDGDAEWADEDLADGRGIFTISKSF